MSANAETVLATEGLKVRWYRATAFKDWIGCPVGEADVWAALHRTVGLFCSSVFKTGFL